MELGFYLCVQLGGPRPARKRRSDSDNVFDDAESLYSTRGVLEVRLSDDPNTAFRQIKTGNLTKFDTFCNHEQFRI